jgi:signal peptidase I
MIRKLVAAAAIVLIGLGVAVSVLTNHSYVDTPSMYPDIPPGSMIFVSPQKTYHVGEVIEFQANGLTWAHRLIDIKPDGTYVTKGDNPQNAPDVFIPAVTRADVAGAVTHAPRWIGFPELIAHRPAYGLAWLRAELGPAGRIVLVVTVGLLSLLFALDWPRRRRQTRAADSNEDELSARTENGSGSVVLA